jgi:hypothetical protein
MAEKRQRHSPSAEELGAQASGIIRRAFKFFSDMLSTFPAEYEEHEKERQEMKKRIEHGPRRTDGRIV